MIVTDQAIADARAAAQTAADELKTAEQAATTRTGPIGGEAATQLGLAVARAHQATARVTALVEQQRAQDAALSSRLVREVAAKYTIDQLDAALIASSSQLAALTATAEAAVVDALQHAVAHDGLVARSRAQLVAAKLVVEEGRDHATAAHERVGLTLRGRPWMPLDAGELLARIVHRTARAVLGVGHIGTMRAEAADRATRIPAGLLDGVPDLAAAAPAPRVRPAAQVIERPETGTAPELIRRAAAAARDLVASAFVPK